MFRWWYMLYSRNFHSYNRCQHYGRGKSGSIHGKPMTICRLQEIYCIHFCEKTDGLSRLHVMTCMNNHICQKSRPASRSPFNWLIFVYLICVLCHISEYFNCMKAASIILGGNHTIAHNHQLIGDPTFPLTAEEEASTATALVTQSQMDRVMDVLSDL